MSFRSQIHFYCFVAGLMAFRLPLAADTIDDVVAAQMVKQKIPGLSLVVMKNGEIAKVKAYGVMEKGKTSLVTPNTLFQAGSVSKSVAALGALHLVEVGKLSLDADVNASLKTWQVPDNKFTNKSKVTLRYLLSHSAGFTVHGFPGYATADPIPTLVQVLNGEKPANTEPIRVDREPGSKWQYSGGGYTVMQQLVIDASGQPFQEFMRAEVLEPLGMQASSFNQPLSPQYDNLAASGHCYSRKFVFTKDIFPISGRWHVYPEMAAGGLWTTPSDLARFALFLRASFAGRNVSVISQALTQEMLTPQKDNDGLGVFVLGQGKTLRFWHSGRNEGFDTLMAAYVETGDGVIIMINANNDSDAGPQILKAISRAYGWPDNFFN